MEANQILQSNLLDILFDGKNKSYGAYELRSAYNKRISMALGIMVSVVVVLAFTFFISKKLNAQVVIVMPIVPDLYVEPIPDVVIPEPELPEPKAAVMPPVATVKVTRPEIVDDKDVLQPPPELEEIANARIDVKTVDGLEDIGMIAPAEVVTGTQIFAGADFKKENPDSLFISVEIDASFPGGNEAWSKYVSRAINKELDEFTDIDFGTCTIQFIVDRNGNVSNVHALDMKGTKLAEIAVNSIRKGPKWIPAIQNGTHVNVLRKQPVTFKQQ